MSLLTENVEDEKDNTSRTNSFLTTFSYKVLHYVCVCMYNFDMKCALLTFYRFYPIST